MTSLFEDARKFQTELGCDETKTRVIPNGVKYWEFENLEEKQPDDPYINIGAVLRVTPIKDVKTMLSAFALAKNKDSRLKLWIMGGMDEAKGYGEECRAMVRDMEIKDVVFTGVINVREYIGKMDFMILTSISEGQPLSILEGFAAKKPFIATNVGNCRGLLEGEKDDYGRAGFITPVMGTTQIAEAILKLAGDRELRSRMGNAGYQRVVHDYDEREVFEKYRGLYEELVSEKAVR